MIDRRKFVAMLGVGAAWPLPLQAQQPTRPVVGLLRSTPAAPFQHLVAALLQGLRDEGFIEGTSITIEQRWADNRRDRLQALATDLVQRKVSAIVGNRLAVEAARAVTATIPIVFVVGDDPVRSGLVKSLNRPGSNLTGVTFFGASQLNAKRMELLHELTPGATVIAVLTDPNFVAFMQELPDVEAAGRALRRQIVVVKAANERELEPAFAKVGQSGAGALLVSGGPLFTSRRRTLVALAARHRIPAIYDLREYVEAGGLISYSASIADAYRQAGQYVGRILKGASPSEMPVAQPTKFELVINMRTAKALGITIPPSVLLRADEVIE